MQYFCARTGQEEDPANKNDGQRREAEGSENIEYLKTTSLHFLLFLRDSVPDFQSVETPKQHKTQWGRLLRSMAGSG